MVAKQLTRMTHLSTAHLGAWPKSWDLVRCRRIDAISAALLVVVQALALALLLLICDVSNAASQAPAPPATAPSLDAKALKADALLRELNRYTYSSGTRVQLGTQASVRLTGPLFLVTDIDSSLQVLKLQGLPVPEHLLAVLHGSIGIDRHAWGTVQFVPAGS